MHDVDDVGRQIDAYVLMPDAGLDHARDAAAAGVGSHQDHGLVHKDCANSQPNSATKVGIALRDMS